MNVNSNAIPSTSSAPYQDSIHGSNGYLNPFQHNASIPMPGMVPQAQWPPMMTQTPHTVTQQQIHPQSHPSWPQMQNQGLPTGMQGLMQQPQSMPGFNMPFIPTQFLQDALRMSAPVGSVSNDDELLVQVLQDSIKNGYTYRRAIETLHGVRYTLPVVHAPPEAFLRHR
jgi:hypothetical protein